MANGPCLNNRNIASEDVVRLRKKYIDEPDISIKDLCTQFRMSETRVREYTKDLVRPPKQRLTNRYPKKRFPFGRSW